MDFGSTREAAVEVHSRTEALAVQEDADAHCRRACRAAHARPHLKKLGLPTSVAAPVQEMQ